MRIRSRSALPPQARVQVEAKLEQAILAEDRAGDTSEKDVATSENGDVLVAPVLSRDELAS